MYRHHGILARGSPWRRSTVGAALRLEFEGNGGCGTEGAGKAWGFLFIGRRSNIGVRARAGNHGEIPGRELRCAGETVLASGAGLLGRKRRWLAGVWA